MKAHANENVDLLIAQTLCQQLVLKTAAMADMQDYQQLADLFTPDATLVRPGAEPLTGKDAILASYRARSKERITKHLVLSTLFSEVSVDAISATSEVLLWSADAADALGPFGRPAKGRQVLGQFADDFVLTESGWLIRQRVARFVLFREPQ